MNCEIYKNRNDAAIQSRLSEWGRHWLTLSRSDRVKFTDNLPLILTCDGTYHMRENGFSAGYFLGFCPQTSGEQAVMQVKAETVKKEADMTFENWKGQKDVLNRVKNFFNSEHETMILSGDVGRGKTHLCKSIHLHLVEQGKTVHMLTAGKLAQLFLRAMPTSDDREERALAANRIDRIHKSDYLILDELKENVSASFIGNLQDLIDSMSGKLIIATNLKLGIPEQEDKNEKSLYWSYGSRIYSRLMSKAHIVKLQGQDYRRNKKEA